MLGEGLWLLEGPSADEFWDVNCCCGQTADSLGGCPANVQSSAHRIMNFILQTCLFMCVLRGEAEEALPSGKSLLIASALEPSHYIALQFS